MSVKQGKPVPLILVSGFLGSGKTTFLNNLFKIFPDSRFGIIINDFGDLGVDAAVIKASDSSLIHELNNGQIFCSCLAGSFIKSVSSYADRDIDYLIVETSGLAKPSPLLEIIEAVKRMSGDSFRYSGMISLVDSATYLKLSEVLKAVDEQIEYSDVVVMNKVDTADAGTLKRVEMKIMSVNPDAEIIRTEFGRITPEQFLSLKHDADIPGPDRRYAGWGSQGRPVPLVMKKDSPLNYNALNEFVNNPGAEYFRIKGHVATDKGQVFVDCTVGSKKISVVEQNPSVEEGLVMIVPADDEAVKSLKERASVIFSTVE